MVVATKTKRDRTKAHQRERQRFMTFASVPQLTNGRELVIDGFAGGGGASLGISRALGYGPDLAINHDAHALSMHRANHPETKHVCENIWNVIPRDVLGDRQVGLAWFSPDCTHFSKAAGKQPTSTRVRGMATVILRWAAAVQPRVIFMENVEEFKTWGPVDKRGYPIAEQAGEHFQRWLINFRRIGYRVEMKELRACDYGAPTIRKRLFIIARRDGEPIVWPQRTHASPAEIAKSLRDNHRCNWLPWRTAAECIDWSIECPSIFLTPEEAKAANVRRPLAPNTLKRIANGVRRYVLEDKQPFLVTCNHGGERFRGQGLDRPIGTLTSSRDARGLVVPYVMTNTTHHRGRSMREPFATLATGDHQYLTTPFLQYLQQGGSERAMIQPFHTITASRKDCNLLVSPWLVPRYGERAGQAPRTVSAEGPLPTITPTANGGRLAVACLSKYHGLKGDESQCLSPAQPLGTLDTSNRFALLSAFIAKHFGGMTGVRADTPFPTITRIATQNNLCVSFLSHQRTSNTGGGEGDLRTPANCITAGGNHAAEVRAFLINYYGSGSGQTGASLKNPLPTVTAKDRMGLVTIRGTVYRIIDIGMRMLTPRELFRAQGFPDSYDISTGINGKPLTKTQQVAMCGNSVCPDVAEALVRANYR